MPTDPFHALRSLRATARPSAVDRPFLRVLTPRNSPFESNRWRLGLPTANEKRLRAAIEYQEKRRCERTEGSAIDESYDPLSYERINY
jgi:hypothetical protein